MFHDDMSTPPPCQFHDGDNSWGTEFEPKNGAVLGVAVDLDEGRVLFGLNGDWQDPMGAAFEGLDTSVGVYPALSGMNMEVMVNFGDHDMKYGPPDGSFFKVKDVVESGSLKWHQKLKRRVMRKFKK